ncbi:MAG: hypothetical protein ACKVS7_13265 [Gemmatimonadaceae bacterium]
MKRIRTVLALLVLAAQAGCSTESITVPAGTVLTGEWSAARLVLALDATGGTTEYDCAHGTLNAPVTVDAAGRFDLSGVHVREHGGPIRTDEELDARPARYFGRYDSGVLTLRVAVDADTLGPFLLRRDARPQLVKCL